MMLAGATEAFFGDNSNNQFLHLQVLFSQNLFSAFPLRNTLMAATLFISPPENSSACHPVCVSL